MRTTTGRALTTAVLVAASLTALPGPAHAADTCFGLTPTVVGAPDQELVEGTEGDDVIVASGTTTVWALGGDDAICVSGPAEVDAGDGDDRVRAHHRTGRNLVVLGSGSDRFEGSAGRDRVYAENFDGEDPSPGSGDANTDVVLTRGGRDRVESGAVQQEDHDRIALGAGDDDLRVLTSLRGDAHFSGGPGSDRLVPWTATDSTAALAYDLAAGTATADGVPFATVESFADLSLSSVAAILAEVRGTGGPNEIYVAAERTSVLARGGRDTVLLYGDPVSALGGAGRDVIEVLGYSDFADLPVVYDLAGETFTRGDVTAPFATEELRVGTTGRAHETVSVLGTAGRDVVVTSACGSVVRGAGGPDLLESRSEQCDGVATTLRGDGGDDVLRGGHERDVLVGGAGRDRALGQEGFDRCRAEVERGCEAG